MSGSKRDRELEAAHRERDEYRSLAQRLGAENARLMAKVIQLYEKLEAAGEALAELRARTPPGREDE
jgi:putative heme degradation protein